MSLHVRGTLAGGVILMGCLIGCSPASRSPDAIRQDAAGVTAATVRDGAAVAKGIFDGLHAKGPLNINKASESQLESLPGIDEPTARRIVEGRPYQNSAELLKKHVLTKRQYNDLAAHITAR